MKGNNHLFFFFFFRRPTVEQRGESFNWGKIGDRESSDM